MAWHLPADQHFQIGPHRTGIWWDKLDDGLYSHSSIFENIVNPLVPVEIVKEPINNGDCS